MSTTVDSVPISDDRIDDVLEDRQGLDLRFRQAMITSAAVHTAVSVLLVVAPIFFAAPTVIPAFTPVEVVQLAPSQPPPEAPEEQPAAVAEPEPPEPEPEPEPEETAPEDPEATLEKEKEAEREKTEEELAREKAEEERRRKEQEAREREEAERRRREEEARREEERRAQPQKAARSTVEPDRELPQVSTRQGEIGVQGGEQARGLTAEEFEFAWYLESMLNKIRARWSPPTRGPYARERQVVVQFRIDRQGRIVAGPEVITSSGNTVYDRAALSAIRNAEPYPPLPTLYRNSTLGVHLGFTQ